MHLKIRAVLQLALVLTASYGAAQDKTMNLTPHWEYVSDQVMGGLSTGQLSISVQGGAEVAHLTGDVSLKNNGGFVQMAFDLKPEGSPFDVSAWTGLEIDVRGPANHYDIRLRTADLARPWQSFRAPFETEDEWQTLRFPFAVFVPHRTEVSFDPKRLRRVGILAIGREFEADIRVKRVALYR